MRLFATCCTGLVIAMLAPTLGLAQAVAGDAAYIKTAESGGPGDIGTKAAIAKIDAKGTLTVIRPGTNGFTCIVGVPGDPEAPICTDQNALTWIVSAATGAPKPTNTLPGIAYMAQGGIHHETATRDVVMMPGKDTHQVKEPPHWMLMWAFDAAASGLPVKENAAGVYIMFAGTPYAHLMIYQNPNSLAK